MIGNCGQILPFTTKLPFIQVEVPNNLYPGGASCCTRHLLAEPHLRCRAGIKISRVETNIEEQTPLPPCEGHCPTIGKPKYKVGLKIFGRTTFGPPPSVRYLLPYQPRSNGFSQPLRCKLFGRSKRGKFKCSGIYGGILPTAGPPTEQIEQLTEQLPDKLPIIAVTEPRGKSPAEVFDRTVKVAHRGLVR